MITAPRIKRFSAIIACTAILTGCNANGVSSMISTISQGAQGLPSTASAAAPTDLLAGMDEKSRTLILQQQLSDLGYNIGTPDGIMGPQTRRAIRAYQASNSLPISGKFDTVTKNSLMMQMAASGQAAQGTQTAQGANAFQLLQQVQQMRNGQMPSNLPGGNAQTQSMFQIIEAMRQ